MSAIAIVSRLLSRDVAVQALSKKVFPIEAPQAEVAPFYVVNIVSDIDEKLLQGAGRYQRTRISIEATATTGTQAIALDNAAFQALRDVIKQTVNTSEGRFVDVDVSFADVAMTGSSLNRDLMVAMRQYFVRWRAG